MIPKITSGKKFEGLIKYNEKMGSECINTHYVPIGSTLLKTLKLVASFNPKCEKNTFHVSLSFPPDEHPSTNLLIEIADDFMERMGYGEQPYGVFQHHDTDNDHIHIVSTRVNWQGKRINDSMEKVRASKICADLEKKYKLQQVNHERKKHSKGNFNVIDKNFNDMNDVSKHISNAIGTVLFGNDPININEYESLLKEYRVGVAVDDLDGVVYYLVDDKGKRKTPSINASSIDAVVMAKGLDKIFDTNKEKREKALNAIKNTLRPNFKWIHEYQAISKATFEKFLNKNNLVPQYATNSSGIYGISFYDTKNKVTIKGSEIGCSWNNMKEKFNDTITFKIGEEKAYIQKIYNKLRRESGAYNESEFITQNVISEILKKEIEKNNNTGLTDYLNQTINKFCKEKLDNIEDIQKDEKERALKRAQMVNSYMSQTSDMGACIIAYAFGYEIENDLLYNEKDNVVLKTNLHGFSIPKKKLSQIPKEVKRAVKDTIMAIEKQQKGLIPECLVFSPKENYASAIIYNTIKDAEKLKQTAEENYINNNYDRLSKSCEKKEELMGQLLYRGIKIKKENNKQVNLKFRGIEIIVDDEELAKTISKYNMDDLNQKATTDSKKLSEINQNDQSDDKNTKWQTKPQTDNFAKWIEDNYKQVNNENTSSNNYENDYKKEFNYPEPHENYYTHYSFPITTIQNGPIISTSFNVTKDKPIFKDELTEEEEEELNRKLKNKKGRKI